MRAAPDDLRRSLVASYERLFRTLALYTGDPESGCAAVDKAWMRAAALWPRVRRLNQQDLWVLKRAVRIAGRKARGGNAAFDPPGGGTAAADSQAARARGLIAQVPGRRKIVVLLRHLWDLEPAQIVDVAGTDERTVDRSLERAAEDLSVAPTEVAALVALATSDLHAEPDVARVVEGGRSLLKSRLAVIGAGTALVAVAVAAVALAPPKPTRTDERRELLPANVARLALPARGRIVTSGGDVVWVIVSEGGADSVARVVDSEVGSTVSVPGRVVSISAARDIAWALVGSPDRRRAVAIDPAEGEVVFNADATGARSIAVTETDLWLARGNELLRRDAATGQGIATIPLGQRAGAVLVSGSSAWVDCGCVEGGLVRVSTDDNRVVARFNRVKMEALGGDRAWVSAVDSRGRRLLTWIEIVTNEIRDEGIQISGEVAATGEDVWVLTDAGGRGPRLVRLDPLNRRSIGAPVPLPLAGATPIAVADGHVWVIDGRSLLRVEV